MARVDEHVSRRERAARALTGPTRRPRPPVTGRGKPPDIAGRRTIAIGDDDVDVARRRFREIPDGDAAHRAGAADDGDAGP